MGLLNKNGKWVFAPIFDNGASLFPRVKINTVTESWVKERVFNFHKSKTMFNDKRERSSYYNVISANEELRKYTQIIDEDKLGLVYTFIDCTPIRRELKSLYKTMIYYRYECIIKQNDFVWKGTL